MCHESQFRSRATFSRPSLARTPSSPRVISKASCRSFSTPAATVVTPYVGLTRATPDRSLCTYHGWTYGLDGKLIGVPGLKDFYKGELEREKWGLISAAKVASYNGFVFATLDPEAPDLAEYLGETGRLGLNMMAGRGDMVVVEGVQNEPHRLQLEICD